MKANETKDMLVAAFLEAKEKGTQHVEEYYNKIKTYVMTTRCEDMFNPNVNLILSLILYNYLYILLKNSLFILG